MVLELFIVDAFTKQQFKGNSAAVVVLSAWLDNAVMQNIAIENNLSETAFLVEIAPNHYAIRWFSPLTEIDFCGHATLASAFVLYQFFACSGELRFSTSQVGELTVTQTEAGRIVMCFPCQAPEPVHEVPAALLAGLSLAPKQVLRNRQAYVVILANEAEVKAVQYDSAQLKTLAPYDVVVTAAGNEVDFVSRYFWPANGGDEDPVTGSIHSALTPFWSKQLAKTELMAVQLSARGGVLYCTMAEDAVIVAGDAVLYLRGSIYL
ncbi:PhzF family phenazine biosynthesis protein [Pseudoalteromonas fenneropenaei]|uniref:PhzF family phenazine biosynthesis protein n=1 Tax=Pseudoalteromonas fenneropenaei TaxID=1737459 RepID=A0ABV7CQJ1_9GAMM